jgi:hypothetical protein
MLPGVNRWFVDRARNRGVRDMALWLGWRPKGKPVVAVPGTIQSVDDLMEEDGPLRERMRMVVARALRFCPKVGPAGYSCPVIDCRGFFAHDTGVHVGPRFISS